MTDSTPPARKAGTPTASQWGQAREKLVAAKKQSSARLGEASEISRTARERLQDIRQSGGASPQQLSEARAEAEMASRHASKESRTITQLNAKIATAEHRSTPDPDRQREASRGNIVRDIHAPGELGQSTKDLQSAVELSSQMQDKNSVVRQQVKAAAGVVTAAPFVNRNIRKGGRAYEEAAQAAGRGRQGISATLRDLAQIPDLPQEVAAEATRLRQRIVMTQRAATERQHEIQRIRSQIKKTMLLVFAVAFLVAGIADLLSIADLGWLADIVILPVTYVIAKRTTRINKGGDMAIAAQAVANKSITTLQQRLSSAIVEANRTDLSGALVSQRIANIGVRFSSYMRNFVLVSFGVQGVELIPIIDWLPCYIGQIAKLMFDQYQAYRISAQFIPPLQQAYALLEKLELFELETMSRPLEELIVMYQEEELAAQEAAEESEAQYPERQDMQDVRPSFQPSYAPAY